MMNQSEPLTRADARPLPLGEVKNSDPLPLGAGRVRVLFALAVAFGLSACGNLEPWVKPCERQALADPIMVMNPHPVSSAYMDHVYEAREGARGALGGGGGGCGCN